MCVCVCVCVKAMRFDIPAPIATELHTRTKDLPGNVLTPISISLAYQNGLKNLPRQIFSAYMKFGGNRCRYVETHRFFMQTHTHIHK